MQASLVRNCMDVCCDKNTIPEIILSVSNVHGSQFAMGVRTYPTDEIIGVLFELLTWISGHSWNCQLKKKFYRKHSEGVSLRLY